MGCCFNTSLKVFFRPLATSIDDSTHKNQGTFFTILQSFTVLCYLINISCDILITKYFYDWNQTTFFIISLTILSFTQVFFMPPSPSFLCTVASYGAQWRVPFFHVRTQLWHGLLSLGFAKTHDSLHKARHVVFYSCIGWLFGPLLPILIFLGSISTFSLRSTDPFLHFLPSFSTQIPKAFSRNYHVNGNQITQPWHPTEKSYSTVSD